MRTNPELRPPPRASVLAQAWRPCARGLPLATLAAATALASAPALYALVRGGRDLSGALVAAALVGGSAFAFVVEDPAEETLAASPTSLARRRGLRLSAIGLGVTAMAAILVALASAATTIGAGDLGRRAGELAAASGVAAAVAGVGHGRRAAGAALGGAVAGLVGVLLVSSFAYRFPELPALVESRHHQRWWAVAVTGWLIAASTWRDPARR